METTYKYSNAEIAQVAEDNSIDEQAFAIYCWNLGITKEYDSEVSAFEDAYVAVTSVREYAEELADDIYPEAVKTGYFDYESFARDLELGGDVWELDGYVFRSY
jgi:antirestriction protein